MEKHSNIPEFMIRHLSNYKYDCKCNNDNMCDAVKKLTKVLKVNKSNTIKDNSNGIPKCIINVVSQINYNNIDNKKAIKLELATDKVLSKYFKGI